MLISVAPAAHLSAAAGGFSLNPADTEMHTPHTAPQNIASYKHEKRITENYKESPAVAGVVSLCHASQLFISGGGRLLFFEQPQIEFRFWREFF